MEYSWKWKTRVSNGIFVEMENLGFKWNIRGNGKLGFFQMEYSWKWKTRVSNRKFVEMEN